MKIKFTGEPSIPELRQAIFEQLQYLEDEFLIRHTKYVTLYITPTDGFGKEVYCQDRRGKKVEELYCHGPYPCAAEDYENR